MYHTDGGLQKKNRLVAPGGPADFYAVCSHHVEKILKKGSRFLKSFADKIGNPCQDVDTFLDRASNP